jgi:hypothetical protein
VKILNRKGVELFSTLEFHFDPLFESMYLNNLKVIDESGKVVATGKPEDCFVLDAPGDETASQRKILHVPISGLSPGCTLELTVTCKDLNPPSTMRFHQNYFSSPLPIRRAAFTLTADMKPITVTASAGVSRKTSGNTTIWQIDDPATVSYEPLMPDYSKFVPMVAISDASATWQRLGDEYLTTIEALLTPDADCKALAARLIAGRNDDDAKIAAIVEHLQSQYAYKALEFGRRARIPQKPSQIIQNKYGDCKDHALLAYQLLRAAGFDASLVLVDTKDVLDPRLPSMDQFDHMVTCIRTADQSYRFIDCTDKESTFSKAPPAHLAEKQVLLLAKGDSKLIEVPSMPADSSDFASKREIVIETGGDLSVRETATIAGPIAAFWRGYFKSSPAESRMKLVQQALASSGLDVQVDDVNCRDLFEIQKPLVVEMRYTIRGRFHRLDDRLAGSVPASWERYWLLPERSERRIAPVHMEIPARYASETVIRPPAGMKLAATNLPPLDLKTPYATLQARFTVGDNQIGLSSTFRTDRGDFEPKAFNELVQSRQKLVNQIEPSLTLQQTK